MKRELILVALGTTMPGVVSAADGGSFNPDISLILSGTYADFKKDPDEYAIPGFALGEETGPGEAGFSLGESELAISANIDPDWYGMFTAAMTPENEVEVENAYVQTTSLGHGLTIRGGRFYSGIGYLNQQHAHTWDFVDSPLPYRAFLGNQLRDDGVQLRWLAPTDLFMEFGGEWLRGDSFPAGGSAEDGRGTWSTFAHIGGDVGASNSWRAGLSYLNAKADDRITESAYGEDSFTGDTKLVIADLVWKWAPNGNAYDRNFKFQAEYIQRKADGDFTPADSETLANNADADGWYAQAIYQFVHGWRVGLRHDELKADDPGAAFADTVLDTQGHKPQRNSIMVDYANSEFSRLRLQYNRDESSPETDDQWFLQYQMALGAHGAHQY